MSYANRITVQVTADASGDATAYTPMIPYGRLSQIRYVKAGTGPYADTVDFTITSEATGETLWAQSNVTASATVAPRQPTHSTAGAAALYASGGTGVLDKIAIANDRIKIVLAQAGNGGTGTFHFVIE